MAIDWEELVRGNARLIARAAAESAEAEPVCVVFDTAAAAGDRSPGLLGVIADTKLNWAVPLLDAAGTKSRVACCAVGRERLLGVLARHEDAAALRAALRLGPAGAAWVVCFDGPGRACYNLRELAPEAG